jgi:hypothetical protein
MTTMMVAIASECGPTTGLSFNQASRAPAMVAWP